MNLTPSCVNRKRKTALIQVVILIMVVFIMPMTGGSQQPETNIDRSGNMDNRDEATQPIRAQDSMRETIRAQIEEMDGPFLRSLDIPEEKLSELIELLVDMTATPQTRNEDSSIRHERSGERAQQNAIVIKKITDLIGAEAYSEFNAYVDKQLERSIIATFNNDPATKEKITSDQFGKVVEAMYEARRTYEARKNNTGTNKVGLVMVSFSLDPIFEEYSKCTESILSKSQFEEFKTFCSTQKTSTPETAPN